MKKIYKLICMFIVLAGLGTSLKAQTYCIPSVASNADEEIAYVMFGTMSNTTTCNVTAPGPGSIGSQYSNFTGSLGLPNTAGTLPIPVAVQGNSYPMAVGVTYCSNSVYSMLFQVFIDYNQNGVLNDLGENVWTQPWPSVGVVSPGFGIFNAPGLGITIPFTATPGLTRLRVWCSETSFANGPCGSITWGEVEDYVINIVPPTPCSTTPGTNIVVTTTAAICPNTSTPLSLLNTYTVGDIGYQWSFSNVSALGPFTVIPTSTTTAALASPNLSITSWFQLQTWCANGGSTLTTAASVVSVQPITTANVPYFEGFEGITTINQLPNCSWTRNNPNCQTNIQTGTNNRVPRTGTKFASVYGYFMNGTNYYYTNGIFLNSGITYSASVWYITEQFGYTNFRELSLLYGTTQSTVGLINIATQSVAVANVYKSLSNTFTVATSGLYYVAVKVVSDASSFAYYLSWDDLSITIPCQLNPVNLGVTATSTSICQGQSINLTASGANTYTWNTGSNSNTISDNPSFNFVYSASGTNTLTNCTATVSRNVIVRPTPVVSIVPGANAVCAGGAVNLTALGATNYTWNIGTGVISSNVSVSPTTNTTYSVSGTFANSNCVGTSTQLITVNPLPSITAVNSPSASCIGQNVNLTAAGSATSFKWYSNVGLLQGNPVVVSPNATTSYTVVGTDENGCDGSFVFSQIVSVCAGISQHSGSIAGLSVYPNPNGGEFTIEVANGLNKTVEISDVTGKVLSSQTTATDKMNLNISNFANGIYYVKVKTNEAFEVLKIVKQ